MRTLLRPASLLSHVLVLVVVAVLVSLGQWQFQRLDERRDQNARLEERLAAAPVDIESLARGGEVDEVALEYRRAEVTGTYLPDEELLLEGRELRGQAGRDSFVPLELDDGTLVLVRRGWVPRDLGRPPLAEAAPPAGEVTVTGYLERSVPQPGFGPRNPEDGELQILQVPDVERIARQLPGPTFPMLLRLTAQDPPPATEAAVDRGLETLPAIHPEQPFEEGSHLSYGIQWYTFALLALIAYVAYWFKRLRGDEPVGPSATGGPSPAGGTNPPEPVGSGQTPL
jgi:surfeit locus 1 family protein